MSTVKQLREALANFEDSDHVVIRVSAQDAAQCIEPKFDAQMQEHEAQFEFYPHVDFTIREVSLTDQHYEPVMICLEAIAYE